MENCAAAALQAMAEYNGRDARRVGHALKVFGYALIIGAGLPAPQRETLLTAAALHDIGIHNAEAKHHSAAGRYQEIEGPPVARAILERLGAAPALTERVCFLVGHHHSYAAIDGPIFRRSLRPISSSTWKKTGWAAPPPRPSGENTSKRPLGAHCFLPCSASRFRRAGRSGLFETVIVRGF